MLFTFAYTISFFVLCHSAMSLGINCRGSSKCDHYQNIVSNMATWYIPQNRSYVSGEHILCWRLNDFVQPGICAFLQKSKGTLAGKDVRGLLQHLYGHGCSVCGSIPVGYPSSNHPSHGILTVNYVRHANCDGACGSWFGDKVDVKEME